VEGVRRHDYLPFGEENVYNAAGGSRTAANGYFLNDGVRQQFVGYERDNETGLDFAQARYYFNVQGRFTSCDPLMASGMTGKPQSWNRYSYSYNNPLRFTDPSGMLAGDFYNLDGNYLGTDGQNDGRRYVVTDKSQAKQIEGANKKGGTTVVSNVSSAVEIPGAAVIAGIGAAVTASNSPSGIDTQGGFHEEGGIFGPTNSGNQIAVPAVAGTYSDPKVPGGSATVDPTHSANPALAKSLTSVSGTYHIHPSGEITVTNQPNTSTTSGTVFGGPPIKQNTYNFIQPASAVDKATFPVFAQQGFGNTHIVVGARSKQVEIYNGGALQATMKLNSFLKIK
jgi:RHS repeat-associated protein